MPSTVTSSCHGLGREDEAGAKQPAVEQDRARAHWPCSHAFFEPAGRAARGARTGGTRGPGRRTRDVRRDRQLDPLAGHPTPPTPASRARGASDPESVAAVSAVPRTSSIGEAAAATAHGRRRRRPRRVTSVGTGAAEPNAARTSRGDGRRQARESNRNHHRVPRPHLHERLHRPARLSRTTTISSSGASALRLTPTTNSANGGRRAW